MKTFFYLITVSIILISCDKNDIEISTNDKVKTKYIYSSSTSAEPYSKTEYTYDHNWNLIKELNIDLPDTHSFSYVYQYDSHGRLINKKYKGKNGLNRSGQTEAVFSVIREYKYQYVDDLQIEMIYYEGELRDSVVYKRFGELLLEVHHYDTRDGNAWFIFNEYDSEGYIIMKRETPNDIITEYEYEDSRLVKTISYNRFGQIQNEVKYRYSISGNKLIMENGMEKVTYVNGNVTEHIRYHPTFPGSEWWCYRYEYY